MGGVSNVTSFVQKWVVPIVMGGAYAWLAYLLHASIGVPWWVIGIAAIAIGYFSVTAGIAWERTRGTGIVVSPVQLDVPMKIFFVDVENGPTPAKVRLHIHPVVDSLGTVHTERPWIGHWRGQPAGYDEELGEGHQAQYGLLGVHHFPSGNPTLYIISTTPTSSPAPFNYTPHTISRDVPLTEQGTTTCHVVVTGVAAGNVRLKPQQFAFSVVPDPGSPVGYRIVPNVTQSATARSSFLSRFTNSIRGAYRWIVDRFQEWQQRQKRRSK
jgi:hypothetical protein